MTIGEVIRKCRKEAGLTQEKMAERLGVTTPAVSKWESGVTKPDISLLAPIARLLGVSTDTLLSFRSELSDAEIQAYVLYIEKLLDEKPFPEAFDEVKRKLEEYPNCPRLIWQAAVILDARRAEEDIGEDGYEKTIIGWYESCLDSEDIPVKNQAARILFYTYLRRGDYVKALDCASYLSRENPERKRMEAAVFSKIGRRDESYRACEELIFTGYSQIQSALNDLRILYLEDNDLEMAEKMTDVQSKAAAAFEMGRYNEISPGLDNAARRKDVIRTERLMRDILNSVSTLGDFAKSRLYQHMTFKDPEPEYFSRIRESLLSSFKSEDFEYMRGNEFWESL